MLEENMEVLDEVKKAVQDALIESDLNIYAPAKIIWEKTPDSNTKVGDHEMAIKFELMGVFFTNESEAFSYIKDHNENGQIYVILTVCPQMGMGYMNPKSQGMSIMELMGGGNLMSDMRIPVPFTWEQILITATMEAKK